MNERKENVRNLSKFLNIRESSLQAILGYCRYWSYHNMKGEGFKKLKDAVNFSHSKEAKEDIQRIVENIPMHKRPAVMSGILGHFSGHIPEKDKGKEDEKA